MPAPSTQVNIIIGIVHVFTLSKLFCMTDDEEGSLPPFTEIKA